MLLEQIHFLRQPKREKTKKEQIDKEHKSNIIDGRDVVFENEHRNRSQKLGYSFVLISDTEKFEGFNDSL